MASDNFIRSAESLILKCVEQTGERLASLVGGEVGFHPDGIAPISATEYARKNRKKAAVLLMESNGDGHAMVLIRMQEAILLAGSLLMMPQIQLKEIIKSGEMGQDLTDAFNEVANIVYGAIDELTHDMSPENGKLRNEGVQLIDPSRESDLATLWPKGATYGGELAVSFPGFETSSAFLVFDETLLSLVTGVCAEETAQPGKSAAEVLLFCVDSTIAIDLKTFFAEKGIEAREFDDMDQAIHFLAQKPVMVVAGFRPGDEAAAEKVCSAARSGKTDIPIVGVSGNPTRETILLARKTGVKAFLVHPFSGDTLRTKVAPFLAGCVKS